MKQGSVTVSWSKSWTTRTSPSPIRRPWLRSEQQGLNNTSWQCWLCRPELTEMEGRRIALTELVQSRPPAAAGSHFTSLGFQQWQKLFAEVEDWRWQWNTSSTSWKSGSVTGEAKCTQQSVEGRTRHRPPHCSGWEGLKLNLNSSWVPVPCWNRRMVK